MAFKINTQMFHNQPIKPQQKQNMQEVSDKIEPSPTPTKPKKATTQKVYPNQNLLNKYKSPGTFINAQNTLGNQLGVGNVFNQSGDDEGENALLGFLQGQNPAFNGLDSIQKGQLSFQESLELEAFIKERINNGKTSDKKVLESLKMRFYNYLAEKS